MREETLNAALKNQDMIYLEEMGRLLIILAARLDIMANVWMEACYGNTVSFLLSIFLQFF